MWQRPRAKYVCRRVSCPCMNHRSEERDPTVYAGSGTRPEADKGSTGTRSGLRCQMWRIWTSPHGIGAPSSQNSCAASTVM
jgi:hypothetical protein